MIAYYRDMSESEYEKLKEMVKKGAKTNESERSLCLASANASSELQKDLKRLSNFASILSAPLLITSSTFTNLTSYKNNLHYI